MTNQPRGPVIYTSEPSKPGDFSTCVPRRAILGCPRCDWITDVTSETPVEDAFAALVEHRKTAEHRIVRASGPETSE